MARIHQHRASFAKTKSKTKRRTTPELSLMQEKNTPATLSIWLVGQTFFSGCEVAHLRSTVCPVAFNPILSKDRGSTTDFVLLGAFPA